MNIIIPMAGRGSRLRPHTLTVPKPLLPVAGKPIVQILVERLAEVCQEKIEEIHLIIGDFGAEVETELKAIASSLGAEGFICYQDEPLGTAHAILCAEKGLSGNVIVAFADTIFSADFEISKNDDGVIWVKKVEHPEAFGVVQLNADGKIIEFVEKPEQFVSDLAIIGVYYFKDGANLKSELQYLIDNNIRDKGEYQLTNALENMKEKGLVFAPGEVSQWLDCGNKEAILDTNNQVLQAIPQQSDFPKESLENSIVKENCHIGEGSSLKNCIIGPGVSIGKNCKLENAIISNSLIQNNNQISNVILKNAMIGSQVVLNGKISDPSLGDYSVFDE